MKNFWSNLVIPLLSMLFYLFDYIETRLKALISRIKMDEMKRRVEWFLIIFTDNLLLYSSFPLSH